MSPGYRRWRDFLDRRRDRGPAQPAADRFASARDVVTAPGQLIADGLDRPPVPVNVDLAYTVGRKDRDCHRRRGKRARRALVGRASCWIGDWCRPHAARRIEHVSTARWPVGCAESGVGRQPRPPGGTSPALIDRSQAASTTVRSRLSAAGRRSVNAEPGSVPTPRPCQSSATVTAMSAVAGSPGYVRR